MIAQAFGKYLVKQERCYCLTPAENLAVVNPVTMLITLFLLVRSQMSLFADSSCDGWKFVGTISLTDIMAYRMQHGLQKKNLWRWDVVHMTRKRWFNMEWNYTISEVLHRIDRWVLLACGRRWSAFRKVYEKSILKAVNALLHDFQADMRWEKAKWKRSNRTV